MDKTRPGYDAEMWEAQYRIEPEKGFFEIYGRSVEEPHKVLQPLLEAFEERLHKPSGEITFNFKMSFFNTETTRIFLTILEKLKRYQAQMNGQVVINWYYAEDDEEMLQSGNEFSEVVEMPFNYTPISENEGV
jgi:hypothetical protein